VRAVGAPVLQVHPETGERMWIVARHADVLAGLRHPDLGHGSRTPMNRLDYIDSRQLINLDPPDHTRLRRLVSRAFTPHTVAALEPKIEAMADALIEGGNLDPTAIPVAVIAELIGVPPEHRVTFRMWSGAIMSGEGREWALEEFTAYVDELADERAARPQDDLISALAAIEELERDELIAMIQLLLIAGQETAVYVIEHGLRALLSSDQWDVLCADPTLAAAAVEEIVRFDGPVEIAPPRVALRDYGSIPAGERVGLALQGANRDPAVFEDPDVFDIRRADLGQHVGFGHGIHFCLGAGLGRLEARVLFRRLAESRFALHIEEGENA
jgi:cytochrome P450